MIINLPWPDKNLFPNKKCHWAIKHKAFQNAKSLSFWKTKEYLPMNREMRGNVLLKYVFHFPDNKSRDIDNLLSSCKAYQDGTAAALKIDDKQFRPIILDRGENIKGGQVEVYLA